MTALLEKLEIIEADAPLLFDPRGDAGPLTLNTDSSDLLFASSSATPSDTRALRHKPESTGRDPVAALRTLIEQLTTLGADWADDESPEPNALALNMCERALQVAANHDLLPSRLRPSPDGGVLLAFQKGSRYGKVEIFNDGDAYLAISGFNYTQPQVFPLRSDLSGLPGAIEIIRSHLGRR